MNQAGLRASASLNRLPWTSRDRDINGTLIIGSDQVSSVDDLPLDGGVPARLRGVCWDLWLPQTDKTLNVNAES